MSINPKNMFERDTLHVLIGLNGERCSFSVEW
jgi:hypothetical protein